MWIEDYDGNWINSDFITRLTVEQRGDDWWIVVNFDFSGISGRLSGPYRSKGVAQDVMQGYLEDIVMSEQQSHSDRYKRMVQPYNYDPDFLGLKNEGFEGTD